MRILHIIPSLDSSSGGPAEGIRHYCAIYKASGHEVEVASLDAPEIVSGLEFPAGAVGLGPGHGVYGYTPRMLPWLKANLARFDVVIINGVWNYNALAAFRALKGTSIPYAIFTHGMLDPYFKERYPIKHLKKLLYWHLFLRKIMVGARTILYTSEEERLLARRSFRNYHVRETVVPYGTFGPECDIGKAAAEFLERWPELRGKRIALCLGRIHPKKATDILIEAFSRTLARHQEWRLVIAGPDQIGWQKGLEVLAERLAISPRIIWTGMIKGPLKWGAYAAAEVFVLPSHQENFGIVVAEALSVGLPALLSEKVNIWREVAERGAGLTDEDTLAGTIRLFDRWSRLSSIEIAEMRERSRRCFDELFNFNVTSRMLVEILDGLARENGETRSGSASSTSRGDGAA